MACTFFFLSALRKEVGARRVPRQFPAEKTQGAQRFTRTFLGIPGFSRVVLFAARKTLRYGFLPKHALNLFTQCPAGA